MSQAFPFNINFRRRQQRQARTPPPAVDPDNIPSDNNDVTKKYDPVLNPTLETGIDPAIFAAARQPDLKPTQPLLEPGPTLEEMNNAPSVHYETARSLSEGGRPVSAEGPNQIEADRALLKATRDYIPQRSSGLRRLTPVAQGAAAAGQASRGNPIAMAGGAITGLVRSLFDPKGVDRDWKRRRQAEISQDIDEQQTQQYREAQIGAMEASAGQRPETLKSKALAEYQKLDNYDPDNPQHAGLKAYFESRGLFNLPKRSKQYAPDVRLVNGQLTRTDKGTGMATNVVNQQTGKAVVDESKTPDKSVTIGDKTYDNLTAREAAILEGRLFQGAANRASREKVSDLNRKSREKVAAMGQAGQDRRTQAQIEATNKRQGVLNTTTRGAIVAISRFRTLTTQIARAEEFGTPETAQALRDQRDGLERMMRMVYGDLLKNDDKGKPTELNEDKINLMGRDDYEESGGSSSGAGLNINDAIKHFEKKHNRKPSAEEVQRMQALIDGQ